MSESKPRVFHKYHKLNIYLYELLINNRFYLANHKELNDPYDCRCKLSNGYVEELYNTSRRNTLPLNNYLEKWRKLDLHDEMMRIYHMTREQDENDLHAKLVLSQGKPQLFSIAETLERIFESEESETKFNNEIIDYFDFNIVSFSIVNEVNDLPMWAYYSGAFEGVRIKLNFESDPTNYLLQSIEEVKYVNWTLVSNDDELKSAYFKKLVNWKEEQEWRIVIYHDKYLSFDKSIVEEITFGYRVPVTQMIGIILLCNKLGYKTNYYLLEYTANGVQKKEVDLTSIKYWEYRHLFT